MTQSHDSPATPPTLQAASPPAKPLGQTVATVLLLIHLFSLFIGVFSNAGPLSPFRMALRNVPLVPEYLQLLDMDEGYDDPLTPGPPEAGAYQLLLTTRAAGSESVILRLPEDSMEPRIRRQRYQKLARGIADLAALYESDPHHQTLLAVGIGKRLLSECRLPVGNYQLSVQRLAPRRLENIQLGLAREAATKVVGMNLLVHSADEFQVALQEKENLTAMVRPEGQQVESRSGESQSEEHRPAESPTAQPDAPSGIPLIPKPPVPKPPVTKPPVTKP